MSVERSRRSGSVLSEHPSVTQTRFSYWPIPGKEEKDLPGHGGEAGPFCRDENPGWALASLR